MQTLGTILFSELDLIAKRCTADVRKSLEHSHGRIHDLYF